MIMNKRKVYYDETTLERFEKKMKGWVSHT